MGVGGALLVAAECQARGADVFAAVGGGDSGVPLTAPAGESLPIPATVDPAAALSALPIPTGCGYAWSRASRAADFAVRAENLTHGFGATLCRVSTATPGALLLEFVRCAALAGAAESLHGSAVPCRANRKNRPIGV
jgi:hypothetical protein